jgi:esterase/lipase
MTEFFEQYGATIIAILLSVSGATTLGVAIRKVVVAIRQIFSTIAKQDERIKITRDGIVEGFKQAFKEANNFQVDISGKVDKTLEAWATKFMTIYAKHEEARTKLSLLNAKVLQATAAHSLLSDVDKKEYELLINQVGANIIEVD